MDSPIISIHDPIHGTIEVTPAEITLIDAQPFQRLRHIKQLGFSELAFPGATHTRYAHSLGAMQMATQMVERVLSALPIAENDKVRFRQMVRLAVLFHDVGHAPFSHVTEKVMPDVVRLNLTDWITGTNRQATHEDYTIKILVDSPLTQIIEEQMQDFGITGRHLASLVLGHAPVNEEESFTIGGHNFLPILHQIVSSEMDADRMDYLRRDAYYCGVNYGNFDHEWLVSNLTALEWDGHWVMALKHRGVWAFENFLLARYHMFLAVYLHHTPVCFDNMLKRYFHSVSYLLPVDINEYLNTDDVFMWNQLRKSENEWAKRVVERRSYRLLFEQHNYGHEATTEVLEKQLSLGKVDFMKSSSQGVLSKYFKHGAITQPPLVVLEPELGRISRIEDYTPLYKRFEEVVGLTRLYCDSDSFPKAAAIMRNLGHHTSGQMKLL
ncbi:MAG: HD domain-containing protein [Myxococcota bacterium]|nr:HD domain-containing protein [Myxococcota bacterium]